MPHGHRVIVYSEDRPIWLKQGNRAKFCNGIYSIHSYEPIVGQYPRNNEGQGWIIYLTTTTTGKAEPKPPHELEDLII
jgi:hypothetical protein